MVPEAESALGRPVFLLVGRRRVAQGPKRPAGRCGAAKAVTAQDVQVGVLERGQPGHVLVQNVVLALLGRQSPQPFPVSFPGTIIRSGTRARP